MSKLLRFYAKTTLLFLLTNVAAKGQLVINELSQGSGTSREYVELVVVGTPSCTASTADLRSWIIDDNNGDFKPGAGSGIASGCIRFTNNSIWQTIKFGTIIVVYDDSQGQLSIPDDLITSDGNCKLVIPFSNTTLIERNITDPSNSSSLYTATGFVPSGNNWGGIVGMRNAGDAFQTRKPGPTLNTGAFHSVSWGDNNSPQANIYFTGDAGGLVFSMKNLINDSIKEQSNWQSDPVATGETPGVGNSPQNIAWINAMSNNCQPFSGAILVINASSAGSSFCLGDTVTLSSSLASGNSWSTGDTASSIMVLSSSTITLNNPAACNTATKIINFESTAAAFSVDSLQGYAPLLVQFTNGSQANAVNFNWNLGDGTIFIDSVSPSYIYSNPGVYQVVLTAKNALGCSDTAIRIITVLTPPNPENVFEIPNVFTPNNDGKNDLFQIQNNNVEKFSGLIFDRWGNKVHKWTNLNEGWNGRTPAGKEVTAGVFFYVLDVTFKDGTSITPSGTLTLVK
jgi:gliding motility-associated-like protein